MYKILSIFTLALMLFSSCSSNNEPAEDKINPSSIEGDWELTKEMFNNQSFDCTENPIKTVLSFKENGYFIYFDDLTNSGLTGKIDKIQIHYRGQYSLENNELELIYSEGEDETTEMYEVKSVSDKSLIIINTDSNKELHYSKR